MRRNSAESSLPKVNTPLFRKPFLPPQVLDGARSIPTFERLGDNGPARARGDRCFRMSGRRPARPLACGG